jgi:hypothetical protein
MILSLMSNREKKNIKLEAQNGEHIVENISGLKSPQ